MNEFEELLKGGHPNSLGNTVAVVTMVLENPSRFEALFRCYFSNDEVVRLRVSNAMKRIAKEQYRLLLPYIDRFLKEVSTINQASTQWTLAQLFYIYQKDLTADQLQNAKIILTQNLNNSNDWIVLNTTMQTLAAWAKNDKALKNWLIPQLEKLSQDNRKSVSKTATRLFEGFA